MARRISNIFSSFWNWKTKINESVIDKRQEQNLTKALGKFEPYVVKLQKVLIWEEPAITIFYVIAVNVLFWIVVNFECRFYGVLFGILLLKQLYEIWFSVVKTPREVKDEGWTSVHPSVLSVPEVSHYLSMYYNTIKDFYMKLKILRVEQPGVFCCGMCFLFFVSLIVGRTVPGLVIAYISIMSLLLGPGIVLHVLPPSVLEKIRYWFAVFKNKDMDSEVEDFLPEQTGENLAFLSVEGQSDSDKDDDVESENLLGEFSLNTEYEGNSSGNLNSISADFSGFPSLDEPSLNEEAGPTDFDLTASATHKISRHFNPDVSDSDEDEVDGMHFQSTHFNGDSSEGEDENAFAKGLSFPASNQSAGVKEIRPLERTGIGDTMATSIVQNVSSSLGAMGQNLLSSVINMATKQSVVSQGSGDKSSDESDDFELISKEDLS